MRNGNVWIIAAVLAVIALAAVLAAVLPARVTAPAADAPTLAPTETVAAETDAPTETAAGIAGASAPGASATPAVMPGANDVQAYLVVTVGPTTYQPLPLTGESEYTVTQQETGAENVIHVTRDSAYMKSSTCGNQDCVSQGVITLDNMSSRILGNMVICLPNQVTLALYTPEELVRLLNGT